MFELFGIEPVLKISLLVFVLIYVSTFIGFHILGDKTSNNGIHLLVGLFIIVSLIAIFATKGITVFSAFLVSFVLIIRPEFSKLKVNFVQPFTSALHFFVIFLVFLFIQFLREPYFSRDHISSSYSDFTFYISASESILNSGVESTLSYLSNYGYEIAPNVYHYFDLYLFLPVFLVKIPPLIGYLYFLIPLLFSLSAYSLIHCFDFNSRKSLYTFFGILSIFVLGFKFGDNEAIYRYSIAYFPKSSVVFFIFLLFQLKSRFNYLDIIALTLIVGLVLNPILFLLILFSSVVLIFLLIWKKFIGFKDFLKLRYLLITVLFLAYFLQFLNGKSDNSVLYTFLVDFNLKEYILGSIFKMKGLTGILQHFPHILLLLLIIIGIKVKNKAFPVSLVSVLLLMCSGYLMATLLHIHFEANQFFMISFAPFLAYVFYFILHELFSIKSKKIIYLSALFLGTTICLFAIGGYSIFTKPRDVYLSSVEFNKSIQDERRKLNSFKAVYFRVVDSETDWIRSLPFLFSELGYLKLYDNSQIIQPTVVSFFNKETSYPKNALNLIGNGPFQKHCDKVKQEPESYYDKSFFIAFQSFIEINKINTLIFDKDLQIPDWVAELKIREIVSPVKPYDNHYVYMLNN